MRSTFKGCGSCILFVITTWIVYKLSLPIFLESLDPEGSMPSDSRFEPKWRRAYGGHHVICHHFQGGVGEQLFQYASLLALARPQTRLLISKDGETILENFLVDVKVTPGASHCKGVEKISEKFCCRDDDRFTNLELNKNYDFEGHFQTWMYFKDKGDFIRRNIQFQKPVLLKAKKAIEKSFKGKNIPDDRLLVGVHIKRGHLVEEQQVIDGYRVAPKEYFQKAFDYYRNLLKKPVFLIISEDTVWCQQNIEQSGDIVHIQWQKPEISMAIFSLVDHAVISVGPFSWWAGYLTKGQVIYYKHPIEPDSKMMTEYGGTLDKTFNPSWIANY